MKLPFLVLAVWFFLPKSYAQKSNADKLKAYEWYIEHNMECKKCISQKKFLENGQIVFVETFSKKSNNNKEPISKYEFEFDSLGNTIGYLKYNRHDSTKNYKEDYKTTYSEEGYIRSETVGCIISEYANFTTHGKPRLILRKPSDDCSINIDSNPYKTELTYDESGNICKAIYHHKKTKFQKDKSNLAFLVNQTVTVWFTHDEHQNLKTLKRAYDPLEEFPVEVWNGDIGGGMNLLYENESYTYVYNNDGLWTKKYRTANGKKTLIAKRMYKRKSPKFYKDWKKHQNRSGTFLQAP